MIHCRLDALSRIVLMLLCCSSMGMAGRGDKSGTAAAGELLIPVGVRAIALGSAGLADERGVDAIYWNPAGLALSHYRSGAVFSHMTYFADIRVNYVAASGMLGDLAYVGLSVKALAVGDIAVTTEDHPDGTGETISPTFLVVGGTVARRITDRISFGLTGNLIFETMGRVSASGLAFNAGVQYSGLGGVEGLNFGVVVKNVGPRLQFDGPGLVRTAQVDDVARPVSPVKLAPASAELPSTIEIGLAYSFPVSEVGQFKLVSAFQNNNFSEDEYRFGGEYVYSSNLALRAGISLASEEDGREYIFLGPTGGVGFWVFTGDYQVGLDYAYRYMGYFGGSHVLGLKVEF